MHVITGVPPHHLFGWVERGKNPVGSRDPSEDLDRLLDPISKLCHDTEAFSDAQRSEPAQLDVVLAVSAPRVDEVTGRVRPARAEAEERARADLYAKIGLRLVGKGLLADPP